MSDMRYASIEPLLADKKVNGQTLLCTFKCPVSGDTFEASTPLAKASNLGAKVGTQVENTLVRTVRQAVGGLLREVFGSGTLSRLGADLASTAARKVAKQPHISKEDEVEAVVAAFAKVAARFMWDGSNHRWVSSRSATGVASPFAQQLGEAPITGIYDQGVLARMMVEVAKADGTLAPEERQFLLEFVPPEVGHVDELMDLPVLDSASLGEVSPGAVRETMLMLAWCVAFTDETLDDTEAARLKEFALGFDLSASREDELKSYAQAFVLEQALQSAYGEGQRNPGKHLQAVALGRSLGLTQAQIEKVDARYRKRNGLV